MPSPSLRVFKILLGSLLACLLASFAPPIPAQQAPVCEAPPEVKAALQLVPEDRKLDQSQYQFAQSRITALRAIIQRYPKDTFVQRQYISQMSYPYSNWEKVRAEYKVLYERDPSDPHLAYLYGATLLGRDTPQAITLLTFALDKAPDLPEPHLDLVQIYSTPNFLDKAKSLSHTKAYISACPDNLNGYWRLLGVDDRDYLRQSAAHLRQLLERRTDSDALSAHTLWSLEFSAHPSSDYDALRKQVSADLVRIRAFNLTKERGWWHTLEEGYKLVNDQKQSDWADEQLQVRFPSPLSVPEQSRWFKDHPYPGADASADKKTTYYSDLLKQTDDWIKRRPSSTTIWENRLDALTNLDDSTPAQIEPCLIKALELEHADAGPEPFDSTTDLQFAKMSYERKLDPKRQLELAQQGLDRLAIELKRPPNDMYQSKKDIDEMGFWRTFAKFSAHFYVADAYIRLKQTDRAQNEVAESDSVLQALKSQINDKDNFRHAYANQESFYWFAMADLAKLQNRKLDAMAFYQSSLLDSLDAADNADLKGRARLEKDAHDLWASLGGTDDGWKSWYGDRAAALANESHLTWETAQDPLPPFQLTDLQGKTWQLADLKGKVVFLNFWASW